MAAARFATKEQAMEVATKFPLAGPVWLVGAIAAVEGLTQGWYVAFPGNVSRRFVQDSEV